MSDPDYVSQEPQHAPTPQVRVVIPTKTSIDRILQLSQTDLDEQLARRLMMEDEQQQQAQWQAQQQQPLVGNATYQPRPGRTSQQAGGGSPGQGENKDTFAEVQEQFTKIAESESETPCRPSFS